MTQEINYIKKALFATYIIVVSAIAATCVLNSAMSQKQKVCADVFFHTKGVSLKHDGRIFQNHSGYISK